MANQEPSGHGQNGAVVLPRVVEAKHFGPVTTNAPMKKKKKLKYVMIPAAPSGMNGPNGLLARRLAVAAIKKDQSLTYANISRIMFKLEPVVLNCQMYHTLNGLHGVNVPHHVLVASCPEQQLIFAEVFLDVILPHAVLMVIG